MIYVAFVYLGALYTTSLVGVSPEKALGTIAYASLGQYAAPVLCVAVMMACLSTTVALIEAFSEFVYNDLVGQKIPLQFIIIVSILISFVFSTMKFSGIAAYLGPILEIMYPGLIVLCILGLIEPWYKFPYTKEVVYGCFMVSALALFF